MTAGAAGERGSHGLRAEPELRQKLGGLSADTGIEQDRADALLARIAWSRLVEPGDGVAGVLVAACGPRDALRLLVERVSPRRITAIARERGADLAADRVREALERWRLRLDRGATVGDIEQALVSGLGIVAPGDPDWPPSLDDLGVHAPMMLWTRGDASLLRTLALSVVGARAATGYGTHITSEIVDGVCRSGVTIVSGAAYGIDAVAHRTALAAESPTIAVLAGGADRAYPSAHDSLLERIARDGLVCAEMIPGAAPTKWRFRARNRLIAALSSATLVTEAGVRSGTLNTAGHAAELGRVLGAVPGPVTSAASAGCHLLVREYGAALVTNARETRELLGLGDRLELFDGETDEGKRVPPLHERLLDAIPLRGSRTLHEIARRAGVSEVDARGGLAELELLGRVRNDDSPGGEGDGWRLIPGE